MQYKHKNHSGQTDEAAITHKALGVYLYTEARPQLPQQIQRNATIYTVSSEKELLLSNTLQIKNKR